MVFFRRCPVCGSKMERDAIPLHIELQHPDYDPEKK